MEKIRIGNDIEIRWAIYAGEGVNEAPYDLTGRNLSLYLVDKFGRNEVYDFTVNRHVLTWKFYGKDQHHLGEYSIELVENEGRTGMHTVDECDAFTLVKRSCETGGDSEGRVECVHLQFRANMGISFPTIGGGESAEVTVDSSLSEVSENPVQNKVITLALKQETERAEMAEMKLTLAIDALEEAVNSTNSKLTALEGRIDEIQESVAEIQSILTPLMERVEILEDKVDNMGGGSLDPEVTEQIGENTEAIEILNADAGTEGSVNNKIASYDQWVEL